MPDACPAESSFGRAMAVLSGAEDITVLSGRGISAEAAGFLAGYPNASPVDAAARRQTWLELLDHPLWAAQPTAAHRALVEWERCGRLRAVITHTVDGLHQKAGISPALVVELSGTMRTAVCLACGDRTPASEPLARLRCGEDDPSCLRCGGQLTLAAAACGQPAAERVQRVARCAVADCDALLVVGSALRADGESDLVRLGAASAASVIMVNAEPTCCDQLAAAVVRTPIEVAVPMLVEASLRARR